MTTLDARMVNRIRRATLLIGIALSPLAVTATVVGQQGDDVAESRKSTPPTHTNSTVPTAFENKEGSTPIQIGLAKLPVATLTDPLLDSGSWSTITVKASGGDYGTLQPAYDRAVTEQQNVRILVEAGHDAGPLILRNRFQRRHWIYVEPMTNNEFPGPGTRATKADARNMYKLRGRLVGGATWTAAIQAEDHAGFTRIIGADIGIPDDDNVRRHSHVVRVRADSDGSDTDDIEALPNQVILDRVYVHLPSNGKRFAAFLVGLYGRNLGLINSYVIGGGRGYEAVKAVNITYGPGPTHIENNYLAASGIGIFLGSNHAAHNEWIPTDVTIRRNHIHKPTAWHGKREVSVKNGLEVKNAIRVLIEQNVFENNWSDAQSGSMILLRAEARNGACEDITLRHNKIINTPAVWDISGIDSSTAKRDGTPRSARRITIHDNVAVKIGRNADFSRKGLICLLKISTNPQAPICDLYFVHNTADDLGGSGLTLAGHASNGALNCVFRDNIFEHGSYGVKRDSTRPGIDSLDAIFGKKRYVWEGNVGAGFPKSLYPSGTNNYTSLTELRSEFNDYSNDDLRLKSGSRYRIGGSHPPTTGRMRGADVELIDRLLVGVVNNVTGE